MNQPTKYQQYFGLPDNNDIEDIRHNIIYGLAIWSAINRSWFYYAGTFPYLWGIYKGMSDLEDQVGPEGISAHTFIYVDRNYIPIKLIHKARLDKTLMLHSGMGWMAEMNNPPILTDLTVISNPPRMRYEDWGFEPMIFEIDY